MKRRLLALALVFALVSTLFCASASAEEPIVFGENLTSADAEISPNTTFDKYTLIRYTFDNGSTAVITCNGKTDDSQYMLQFNYDGKGQTVVCAPDGTVFYDAGGIMGDAAPLIMKEVQKATVWAPIAVSYDMTEWECQNGDKTIRGHYMLPKDYTEGKLPTIIFSHGFNSTHMQVTVNYAAKIVDEGYACILFDFCGGSAQSTSDGSGTEMSIFTEEEELKRVFEAAKELDFVDADRMFLLGCSQGGVVSAMAAADLQDEVKALVLCFPAFTLVDDAKAAYASIDEVPETVEVMGYTIGRTYYEGLFDLDILADVTRYKGDVLILHGTADNIAPYSYSEAAVKAYESASLIPIEGAGHGFRDKHLDEAMVHISEFIAAHAH